MIGSCFRRSLVGIVVMLSSVQASAVDTQGAIAGISLGSILFFMAVVVTATGIPDRNEAIVFGSGSTFLFLPIIIVCSVLFTNPDMGVAQNGLVAGIAYGAVGVCICCVQIARLSNERRKQKETAAFFLLFAFIPLLISCAIMFAHPERSTQLSTEGTKRSYLAEVWFDMSCVDEHYTNVKGMENPRQNVTDTTDTFFKDITIDGFLGAFCYAHVISMMNSLANMPQPSSVGVAMFTIWLLCLLAQLICSILTICLFVFGMMSFTLTFQQEAYHDCTRRFAATSTSKLFMWNLFACIFHPVILMQLATIAVQILVFRAALNQGTKKAEKGNEKAKRNARDAKRIGDWRAGREAERLEEDEKNLEKKAKAAQNEAFQATDVRTKARAYCNCLSMEAEAKTKAMHATNVKCMQRTNIQLQACRIAISKGALNTVSFLEDFIGPSVMCIMVCWMAWCLACFVVFLAFIFAWPFIPVSILLLVFIFVYFIVVEEIVKTIIDKIEDFAAPQTDDNSILATFKKLFGSLAGSKQKASSKGHVWSRKLFGARAWPMPFPKMVLNRFNNKKQISFIQFFIIVFAFAPLCIYGTILCFDVYSGSSLSSSSGLLEQLYSHLFQNFQIGLFFRIPGIPKLSFGSLEVVLNVIKGKWAKLSLESWFFNTKGFMEAAAACSSAGFLFSIFKLLSSWSAQAMEAIGTLSEKIPKLVTMKKIGEAIKEEFRDDFDGNLDDVFEDSYVGHLNDINDAADRISGPMRRMSKKLVI